MPRTRSRSTRRSFEEYLRYFRLKSKNPLGSESPVWRTQCPSTGREGHPPVVVVFNPGI
ncbi:hypothetical protein [Streptomyces sp. NPDC058086]|uniref:hypothetical protein n=1 Tax=Streptomyces sp. NPDC058086 TaxID=3346334 RepID=UPI0036E8862E